jgi:REP element-mobilizing transposase RayT
LTGYDYSLAGAYFVTICTQDRICSLCTIDPNGSQHMTPAGEIARDIWLSLRDRFAFVSIDAFVVMPNHVHAVLLLSDPQPVGKPRVPKQLGSVIRTFKAASSRVIRKAGVTDFAWQTDYYDHIVRNQGELERIREYIAANPARWAEDPENPSASGLIGEPEPWAQ